MRYTVRAYLCTNFAGLMDSLETDNFYEVQDFIWENCQKGYNCELINHVTGEHDWVYAEDFNEETVELDDLIRAHKKNELLEDLLLEQQEQM